MYDAREITRNQVSAKIEGFLREASDPAGIVRPELANSPFKPVEGSLLFLVTFLRDFHSSKAISLVPHNVLANLQQPLDELTAAAKSMKSFNPQEPKSQELAESILGRFEAGYHPLVHQFAPLLSYQRVGGIFQRIEAIAAGAEKRAEDILKKVTETRGTADERLKDLEATVSRAKELAAETGVARHAGHFGAAATEHEVAARRWFAATIACILIGFGGAAWFVPEIHSDATGPSVAQVLLPRAIVATLFFTALIWCARNYAASRHNAIVNRHRFNALRTFETFAKAAQDAEARDAVLKVATKSIFAPQSTGYLKTASEPPQQSQVVELVRGVVGKE